MGEYPEHDKLMAVKDETQAAGEFIEWLESQGVALMMWREDLTDTRPVDPQCPKNGTGRRKLACDQPRPGGPHTTYDENGVAYWLRHCKHWADGGDCCRCGNGQFHEITGVKAWVPTGKSLTELLAGWQDIDLAKLEAEKRAMLKRCQEMAS